MLIKLSGNKFCINKTLSLSLVFIIFFVSIVLFVQILDSKIHTTNSRAAITQADLLNNYKIANKYSNGVFFSQLTDKNSIWADKPLPGGCEESPQANKMGKSGCNAAVVAHVASYHGVRYDGQVVTPDLVIERIYPNMGKNSINLSCSGTSAPTVRAALQILGFSVENGSAEKLYSLQTAAKYAGEIDDGKTDVIIGLKYKAGKSFYTHWSIIKGIDSEGNVLLYDSYFGSKSYVDPDSVIHPEMDAERKDDPNFNTITYKFVEYTDSFIVTYIGNSQNDFIAKPSISPTSVVTSPEVIPTVFVMPTVKILPNSSISLEGCKGVCLGNFDKEYKIGSTVGEYSCCCKSEISYAVWVKQQTCVTNNLP